MGRFRLKWLLPVVPPKKRETWAFNLLIISAEGEKLEKVLRGEKKGISSGKVRKNVLIGKEEGLESSLLACGGRRVKMLLEKEISTYFRDYPEKCVIFHISHKHNIPWKARY